MLGRTDGLLNVAGIRLGPREIEQVIISHPAVAEASVVGVADALRGEVPVCFVVLKRGFKPSGHLGVEIRVLVRERVGAIAAPRGVRFVDTLPMKRQSG